MPMPMPIYVSPQTVNGGTKPQEFMDRVNAGWGGGWFYYTSGDLDWPNGLTQLIAAEPQGYPIFASPKGTSAAPTNAFLSGLPPAWREKVTLAYFQEPEDDHTTDAARADFRAHVVTLAELARPWGARNGVHLQEWAINPANGNSWGGTVHTAKFVQGIEDSIDFAGWSLLGNINDHWNLWKAKADRIISFMATYLPGIEWGVTSSGLPVDVSDPMGGTARINRAQWTKDLAHYLADNGATAYGWFDWYNYNGNSKDQRADMDPLLLDALQYAANIDLPDDEPPSSPSPAEPTHVASSGAVTVTGGGTLLNITVPADAQPGDTALLFVDAMNNLAPASTVPGWQALGVGRETQNVTSELFMREVTASDPGSTLTITLGQGNIRYTAHMVVYRGVDPDAVSHVYAGRGGSATITTPTLAVDHGGFLVEHVVERANPVGTALTAPAGITKRLDTSPVFTGVSVRAATGDALTDAATVGGNGWLSTISTNHQGAWTVHLPVAAPFEPEGTVWQVRTASGWEPRRVRRRVQGGWVG